MKLAATLAAAVLFASPAIAAAQVVDAPPPSSPASSSPPTDAAPGDPAVPAPGSDPGALVAVGVSIAPAPVPPPAIAIAAPGTVPAAPAVVPAPSEPVGLERLVANDASADRAFLAPTALMPAAGTVTVHARQPIAPGGFDSIAVALTSRLELSVGFVWALDAGDTPLSVGAKLQLWRSPRAALAIQGGVLRASRDESFGEVSLVGTACVDAPCDVVLSGNVMAGFAGGANSSDRGETAVPIVAGGSMLIGGGASKLLLEAHVARDREAVGMAAFAGLRFAGHTASLDAGLGIIGGGDDHDSGVLPWPMVAGSYRF